MYTAVLHICNTHSHTYRLALEMAAENSVTLPTTTAANAVYVAAMEKDSNIGDQDFCAVIQAYKK